MTDSDIVMLDFQKLGGLVPAIIQDPASNVVLMLGFMNQEALNATLKRQKVVFWSRTKQRLWMKGEESGNILELGTIYVDCDQDTLLINAKQIGTGTCHTGTPTCFNTQLTKDIL